MKQQPVWPARPRTWEEKNGMEFFDVVETRRSVRLFDSRPLPREELMQVLAAANAAPSAHNGQPWHFCVAHGSRAVAALLQDTEAAMQADMRRAGADDESLVRAVETSRRRLGTAGALVCVFVPPAEPGQPEDGVEAELRAQSAAAATTQMLLAAHALGLGACWHSLALRCPDVLRRHFENAGRPVALVALGHPADALPGRPFKKNLDEVVTFCDGTGEEKP
ncbi:nitroreductase family protein [Clostridia bacterium OttesenSCG-928-O13]|nr:nitroreductase family protein [Clostridia bacterium OttesenSCG-928-O13]